MLGNQLNNDNDLNAYLLRRIISAYQNNDHQILSEMGLPPELLERARNMSADLFTQACKFTIAETKIDHRRFELMLDYAERERELNELINELIKRGASQSMLDALTGIDPREYRSRRKLLKMPPATQGRPAALNDDQIETLCSALRDQKCPNDDLNRYLFLGANTELPLAQIWSHMKLYGE